MTEHPYEPFLDAVHNPSQYIGGEKHSVVKDRETVNCRVALCFPETYPIGMSHLGLKILYSILNRLPGVWAERFFAPEPDLEAKLQEYGERLRSLESRDPLSAFDIVGFSVSTELCFTEILAMLDLGGVPLRSAERKPTDPLVIGGGASVFNPEPVAEFFDLFVIGDAEETLPSLVQKTTEMKRAGASRHELLMALSHIKGIYVPGFFAVDYDGPRIKDIHPVSEGLPTPERAVLDDLSKSPFPFDMVIPYGQPVFDRLSVEIDRGCTGGCRYCQAGITYRPVRERTAEDILQIVERGTRETGFDEVSLASLSTGDHNSIEQIITRIMNSAEKENVSLSLPSLRSGTLSSALIRQIGRGRMTGFTITAETGTQRLRNVINKKITDEEILDTARKVLAGGWRILKLYFMIGLPTETEEDVKGIAEMVRQICFLKENGRRFQTINVGVSQFVPKAQTPFQWVPMDSRETLHAKKMYLLGEFKKIKSAKLKGHDTDMSYIEGVFSRGDRRLGKAVYLAWRKGCRLDGWSEHFRMDLWLEAFKEAGVNPDDHALRERERTEVLPWDHIDIGVAKKFLLRELKEAEKGNVTVDCRYGDCLGCGLPANDNIIQKPIEPVAETSGEKSGVSAQTFRYRIRFRKEGLARYLSHLETVIAMSRALRRARLPVAYTEGFHPHQKMSFGPALPVGVASSSEALDLEFAEQLESDRIVLTLNKELENGLSVFAAELLAPPYRSIQASTGSTVWEITDIGENVPPLEVIRGAVLQMENTVAGEITAVDGGKRLRFETKLEGVMGKLKKAGFAISGKRKLGKAPL